MGYKGEDLLVKILRLVVLSSVIGARSTWKVTLDWVVQVNHRVCLEWHKVHDTRS